MQDTIRAARILLVSAMTVCVLVGCARRAASPTMREVLLEFMAPGGREEQVERIKIDRHPSVEFVTSDPARVHLLLDSLRALSLDPTIDTGVKWTSYGSMLLTRSDGFELGIALMAVDGKCALRLSDTYYSGDKSIDDWCAAVGAVPK